MQQIGERKNAHQERAIVTWNGFAALAVGLLLLAAGIWQLLRGMPYSGPPSMSGLVAALLIFALLFLLGLLILAGLYTLQPNEAVILQLFGSYRGSSRVPGLRGTNPFYSRRKISLRARNLNGERLKVNDKRGNPIEIAAVVVWRVDDTARASFDVDNYENYVKLQSEAAVRHLASAFAYDHADTLAGSAPEPTLLASADSVSRALVVELQQRLDKAGVVVEEARLMHLAYAPEIAQVMLRRQQAEAIIAARTKIVHGAVSMVEMALRELSEKQVVALDDERKAAMVSNLMTVLCAESEVQPVINTGTLYN
ncbi:MAG TPA: SPFH domain-containing protein [Casimicrobiaceae bacterium]|jgi:regulator of protease activity HflC (stomatin/prohibitin superfamily)|nr:SPFH domain-containing protein [Casimicrobiaceae bacterium]